jgi:hypothetical protein
VSRRAAGPRLLTTLLVVAGSLPLASVVGLAPLGVGTVRAAEYTMTTVARYDVRPDDREVDVSVEVTFKNTTPNPSGQFSIFEVIDLGVHDGARGAAARDADGALTVSVAQRGGVTVASVRLRAGVRYSEDATFTLTYEIPDGSSSSVRIRPSVVIFPAWSFGTSGRVSVTVPATFEVAVDGDELVAERDGERWILRSDAIADPTGWLAQVTASGPASHVTLTDGVPLASGTVDLQVRAWADDEAWGERVLALVADALPRLEAEIGLDYPEVGPLVVSESLPGPDDALGEPASSGAEIVAGYSEPDFTLLHQLAHVWLGERLVGDRWIREGFASRAAAAVAGDEVTLPFDPEARMDELAADAFPLVSWGAGASTPAQDGFAYAASWAVAEELAGLVGEDGLRLAWQRIAAGIGPYEPVSDELPVATDRPLTPIGARALLDQLEAVSEADLAPIFAERVFDEDAAADLEARDAARRAYDELLAAAASWGAPDPVRLSMAAWRFDDASAQIDEALDWLADRDALAAAVEGAGLALPARLRDRYVTAGGGPDARAELAAEVAVVDSYRSGADRAAVERSILEQVGLLGGREPESLLAEARDLFAAGDLRGAADATAEARARLDSATSDGIVRLVSVVVLAAALLLLAVWLARRRGRRSATRYTAAP